jgi:hypothetical protein
MTEIRRIRVDEASIVRELYRGAVDELAKSYPEDRIGISDQGLSNLETQFRLGAAHEDEATFVADEGGELVGFVTASISRGRALPGAVGEIHELSASDGDHERRLAETAIRWLSEQGARAIFHTEDAVHPQREPWESLGFEVDVLRFSRYE